MAQDFYAAFEFGNDDKTIPSMDRDGVALAAIQGLNAKVESKDAKIAELNDSVANQSELIAVQSEMIAELNQRMEQLESLVTAQQK